MNKLDIVYKQYKKQMLLICLVFTSLCIIFGFFLLKTYNNSDTTTITVARFSLEEYAEYVFQKCSSESYRPTCYDEEIPKLMDFISFEDAFVVVSLIQEKYDGYWYCHVLGHKLAARETAKDPSLWKDVISRAPTGICSNGSIHGAFLERFRTQSLGGDQYEEFLLEAGDVCEKRPTWNPTSLEQATCYHALGHLAMYATNGDIHRSVDACVIITESNNKLNYGRLCYDGAFMQIFQPLEPEDFALIEGKQPAKEEVEEFCSQFSDLQKPSCLSEAWPLFGEELKVSDGLESFCSAQKKINDEAYFSCYRRRFYLVASDFDFHVPKISEYCSKMKDEFMFECFKVSITRIIDADYKLINRVVDLCDGMETYIKDKSNGNRDLCYKHLISRINFNFHYLSNKFGFACRALPEEYRSDCIEGYV